jgi:hypothetical protein
MTPTSTRSVELLELASLFLWVASLDDIDAERTRLEMFHKVDLAVHEVNYPTHSGKRCTRVTWKVCA